VTHIPDYIYYGDEPTAEPAFRTLLYLKGSMNDRGVEEPLTALFDVFVDTYKGNLWGLMIREGININSKT
jgi:hypothetical protein